MTKQEIKVALKAACCCVSYVNTCPNDCPYSELSQPECSRKINEALNLIAGGFVDLRDDPETFTKDLPFALEEGAKLPTRGHAQDAGLDLYSREAKTIPLYGYEEFDTGVHVELPPGSCGLLVSKSGLNINRNLISTGLIDEGYSGSIKVKLYNLGDKDQRIQKGAKISQLLILPVMTMNPVLVEEVAGGDRGSDGFGSTGD